MSSVDSTSARPPEESAPRTLWLVGTLVTAGGVVLVALLYYGPAADPSLPPVRADILKSLAGAILQLTVLGVVGVAVKSAFDRHQERRREAREAAEKTQQRRSALTELHKALLRRVLAANRVVRKSRILMPAHASARTYGEQMRVLIDAGFEFSDIRHEIETIRTLFATGREEIKEHLNAMERFLERLTEEYQLRYQDVVLVENNEDRAAVREALLTLDAYRDFVDAGKESLLHTVYLPSYYAARDAMRLEILGGLLVPARTAAEAS